MNKCFRPVSESTNKKGLKGNLKSFFACCKSLFLLEQGNHKEQHTCADDGNDELPKESGLLDSDEAHEPAADETADNTDDDVDNQSEAAAFHQFASQPASHCAEEQIKDNANNVHSFRFWLNIYDGAKVQK